MQNDLNMSLKDHPKNELSLLQVQCPESCLIISVIHRRPIAQLRLLQISAEDLFTTHQNTLRSKEVSNRCFRYALVPILSSLHSTLASSESFYGRPV